jgi:two-component system chemotaxis response regulator CheY
MIRDVVLSLGIKPVEITKTIDKAQEIILMKKLSLIIMETYIDNDSTLYLVNWLRKINNINKTVPVISITSNATKDLVSLARDTGVTEFVLKPFTNASLSSAIISATKSPRNFIITRNFAGPDRRRKDVIPPDGEEKRSSIKSKDFNNE